VAAAILPCVSGYSAESAPTNDSSALVSEWEGSAADSGTVWMMVINTNMTGALGTTEVRSPLLIWRITKVSLSGQDVNFEVEPAHAKVPKCGFRGSYRKLWAAEWIEITAVGENGKEGKKIFLRKSAAVNETRARIKSAVSELLGATRGHPENNQSKQ
jgi:hypothetical protein